MEALGRIRDRRCAAGASGVYRRKLVSCCLECSRAVAAVVLKRKERSISIMIIIVTFIAAELVQLDVQLLVGTCAAKLE